MATIMAKEKEREFIIECIQLYRDLPALWNLKCKVYYDRDKKNVAYDLLLSKYQEFFPEATREDLKKKFNALRTNYRKELKKYTESMKSGADGVYEPTLWYYTEMNFLREHEVVGDSKSSLDAQNSAAVEENYVEQNADSQFSTLDEADDFRVHNNDPLKIFKKHAPKRARNEEKIVNFAFEDLSEKKDEYTYWAMSCAADLRKMDAIQQLYAKKAIADVLMEGQLGQLHRHSVKINEGQYSTAFSSMAPPSTTHVNPSVHITVTPTYASQPSVQYTVKSSPSSSPSSPLR